VDQLAVPFIPDIYPSVALIEAFWLANAQTLYFSQNNSHIEKIAVAIRVVEAGVGAEKVFDGRRCDGEISREALAVRLLIAIAFTFAPITESTEPSFATTRVALLTGRALAIALPIETKSIGAVAALARGPIFFWSTTNATATFARICPASWSATRTAGISVGVKACPAFTAAFSAIRTHTWRTVAFAIALVAGCWVTTWTCASRAAAVPIFSYTGSTATRSNETVRA